MFSRSGETSSRTVHHCELVNYKASLATSILCCFLLSLASLGASACCFFVPLLSCVHPFAFFGMTPGMMPLLRQLTAYQKRLRDADVKLASQGPDTLRQVSSKPDNLVLDS